MPETILIIDDDQAIATALTARLQWNGFKVVHAANGTVGIQAAAIHRPNVILLDIRMPDIDGFEVCARIRAQPDSASTPIIFLSANCQEQFRRKASEVGGSMFLTKPFRSAEVLDAIRSVTGTPSPCQQGEVTNA